MLFAALALAVSTLADPGGAAADAVALRASATAMRASGELTDEVWQTVPPVDDFVAARAGRGRRPQASGPSSASPTTRPPSS